MRCWSLETLGGATGLLGPGIAAGNTYLSNAATARAPHPLAIDKDCLDLSLGSIAS